MRCILEVHGEVDRTNVGMMRTFMWHEQLIDELKVPIVVLPDLLVVFGADFFACVREEIGGDRALLIRHALCVCWGGGGALNLKQPIQIWVCVKRMGDEVVQVFAELVPASDTRHWGGHITFVKNSKYQRCEPHH